MSPSTMSAERTVSFAPSITVQPVDKLATTTEEKSSLYYSPDEMASFNQEVKTIRTLTKAQHLIATEDVHDGASSAASSASQSKGIILSPERLSSNPALRGLELHLLSTRVKNKILAQKALLKYQRGLCYDSSKSSEDRAQCLAAAASRLTRWSTQVALETARMDSMQAYDVDSYRIPLVQCEVIIERFPISMAKKRRVTEEDGQAPSMPMANKRQRC